MSPGLGLVPTPNQTGRYSKKEDTWLTDARRHSRHPRQTRPNGAARYHSQYWTPSPAAATQALWVGAHRGLASDFSTFWTAFLVDLAPQTGGRRTKWQAGRRRRHRDP